MGNKIWDLRFTIYDSSRTEDVYRNRPAFDLPKIARINLEFQRAEEATE